jgi:hypothetical protein
MKRIISAFAVLAIVGSALAFKPAFNQGVIYCESTCTSTPVDFQLDQNGNRTAVCGISGGVEITEYQKVSGVCTPIAANQKYSATPR